MDRNGTELYQTGEEQPSVDSVLEPQYRPREQPSRQMEPPSQRQPQLTQAEIIVNGGACSLLLPEFEDRFKPTAPLTPLQQATIDHEERMRASNLLARAERDRAFEHSQQLYTQTRKIVATDMRHAKKEASNRKRAEAAQRAKELEERLRVGREVAGYKAVEKIRRRMGLQDDD